MVIIIAVTDFPIIKLHKAAAEMHLLLRFDNNTGTGNECVCVCVDVDLCAGERELNWCQGGALGSALHFSMSSLLVFVLFNCIVVYVNVLLLHPSTVRVIM